MNHIPQFDGLSPPPLPAWLRHHPADWVPGTLDRAALQAAATALQLQPGFDADARHFAIHWQAAYDSSTTLHAVMRDTPRYLLLVACLRLAHTHAGSGDGQAGITPTRLTHFLTGGGRQLASISPSRVKVMLGHAKAHGLLQPVAGRGDARLHPLEPTPRLQGAMALWVTGFLHGIAPRMPLPCTPEAMVATPGFVGELFTYRLAGFVEDRFILSEGLPALRWIMDRTKGYHLFLSLMRRLQRQPDGTALTLAPPAALAAQSRVSRATVQNLLKGCQQQGWLTQDSTPQQWRLSAGFTTEALHWMALEFLWMHGLAVAAWHRVHGSAAPVIRPA